MAADKKQFRNNKFNVEWMYAKACWDALKEGREVPPIPHYTLWETNEQRQEKVIGTKEISPKRVTCNGVTIYGD